MSRPDSAKTMARIPINPKVLISHSGLRKPGPAAGRARDVDAGDLRTGTAAGRGPTGVQTDGGRTDTPVHARGESGDGARHPHRYPPSRGAEPRRPGKACDGALRPPGATSTVTDATGPPDGPGAVDHHAIHTALEVGGGRHHAVAGLGRATPGGGHLHPQRGSIRRCRAPPAATTTGSAARTTSPPTGSPATRSPPRSRPIRTAARGEPARSCAAPCGYLAGEAGIRQFLDIGTGLPDRRQHPRGRAGRRPGVPGRLRRQRPDRAGPRPGAADRHARGRHRVPRRRPARPGADPRPPGPARAPST